MVPLVSINGLKHSMVFQDIKLFCSYSGGKGRKKNPQLEWNIRYVQTYMILKNNMWKMLWSPQMKELWDEIGLSQQYQFTSSTTMYLDNVPVSLTSTILKAFNTDYYTVNKSFSCENSEKVDYMYITAENGSDK